MLEHISLFEPDIIITKDLQQLLDTLKTNNIAYKIENNIVYFEAIPYEFYISCAILVSFVDQVITKVYINANYELFNLENKVALSDNFLETLENNIGVSSTTYFDPLKNMTIDRWYADKMFLQLSRNKDHNNASAVFILSEVLLKKNFFKKQNFFFSLIFSFSLSLILLIINLFSKNKDGLLLTFIYFFITLFIILFLILSLINYFKKPLDLNDNKHYKKLIMKKELINELNVSYCGSVTFNNVPKNYLCLFMYTKNEVLLYFIKNNEVLLRTLKKDDLKDISLFDETLTINLTNDDLIFFNPKMMAETTSFIADFNYFIKK